MPPASSSAGSSTRSPTACRNGRWRWAISSSRGRSSAKASILRARGVDHVLAVPGMLFAAGHVKNDVPSVLNAYAAEHGLKLQMGRDLGIDAKLLAAARDRIDAALGVAKRCRPGRDLPLVVGRGTSDSDANGNVAKVARMLWEGIGFAHAEIGYSGVAHPRTEVALERACAWASGASSSFPTSCSPASWSAGSTRPSRWSRHAIRGSTSSTRTISTTTRW